MWDYIHVFLNGEMPIISHFRDIFSNIPNTFGSNWQISAGLWWQDPEPVCGHHELLK